MTESIFDLNVLLTPLNLGEKGVGQDLRSDYSPTSPYQKLRDARAAARAEERMQDVDGAMVANSWHEVLAVGLEALATQSKDFEIAAWVTEALVRIHGLAGLTAGAQLIFGLCEAFWTDGFPQSDEDGFEARVSAVGGLSGSGAEGTITQPLRRLPLFHRGDGSDVGLYQWDQSEKTATLNEERRQARYAAGDLELAALKSEARLDMAYLSTILRQANAALKVWLDLEKTLDARLEANAPSLRNVKQLLERISEVATGLGARDSDAQVDANSPIEGQAADGSQAVAVAQSSNSPRGALVTREDALRELDRIAEYFRRTEPQSPLAYTLEETVRRGRMTMVELMNEVLPEEEIRNAMLARLGMRRN